ncbi:MAG: outer membrane protein assembly factor BamD [Bacteroidales bacterium]|nr:outer membrane protein assembly factor BamD [Bacteroidales bacterium]
MPDARWNQVVSGGVALILTAVSTFSGGCSGLKGIRSRSYSAVRSIITSSYHDPNAEAKMAAAEQLFQEGRYKEAEVSYADVADNTYNPVLMAEKARFMESECLRLQGKLHAAITHYHRQLQDFPTGPYREKACTQIYDIAYKWLESGTLADIENEMKGVKRSWFSTLTRTLPDVTDASRPTLDSEGEALKYLEVAHTHDLTGPTADKALFWCGYVHFYRGRYEDADYFFSQLVELHKNSPLWEEALKLAVIAKNNSTGGAVYDSTKAAEALQLVHHAEAAIPEFNQSSEKAAWLTRQKFAVRLQLAQKDFQMAQYYERTKHLPSAYFYYELVTRRYPGTKLAEQAKARMAALDHVRQQREIEKASGSSGNPLEAIRQGITDLTTPSPSAEDAPVDPPASQPLPGPRELPPDISNPR